MRKSVLMIFSIFEGDTLIDFEQILFVKKITLEKLKDPLPLVAPCLPFGLEEAFKEGKL